MEGLDEMASDDFVPKLRSGIEIVHMDTSFDPPRYLLKIAERKNIEISETYYRLISLINGKRSAGQISDELETKFSIRILPQDIKRIIEDSLVPKGIIESDLNTDETPVGRSYLSYKQALLSQRSLVPLTSVLQFLFERRTFIILTSAGFAFEIFFYFVLKQPTVSILQISGNDLIACYGVFFLSTMFHELGHLSACHRFGALYKDMGIGIYFYFPVFYSDVTDAWKLKRKQRATVDFGGVYFQLLLLPVLLLLNLTTGDVGFIFVIYFLNFSIATTLNPFLKFDGYWLLSDLIGVPNLRSRSREMFAYWRSRFIGKRIKQPKFIIDLSKRTLYYLFIYTIACNVFFAFFAINILSQFAFAVLSYRAFIADIASSYTTGAGALFSSVTKFLFVNFVIFSLILMVFRWLHAVIRRIVSIASRRRLATN